MADEADRGTGSAGAPRPRAQVTRALTAASVVASLAPAVMATADVAGLRGAWTLVTAALLSAAAAASPLSGVLGRWRHQGDDGRGLAAVLLIEPPPLVADADPYAVGVFPSQRAMDAAGSDRPPYVRRDIDDALDRAFTAEELARRDGVVVLCGAPGSGLSRTLWEALRRNTDDKVVYALAPPEPGDGRGPRRRPIEMLLSAELPVPGEQMVLWLDDAHDHLECGLTAHNLRRLRQTYPGIVVAATLHDDRLPGIRRTDRELARRLESARVDGTLRAELSADEVERAGAAYPALAPGDVLTRLPAWLQGADLLQARYAEGASNPHGRAVTRAAVDWHRTGMGPIVPRHELRKLASIELAREDAPARLTDEGFAAALAWATEEEMAGISLLRRVPGERGDRFRATDVAIAEVEAEGPVSQACWDHVVDRASGPTRLLVGYHAYLAGRRDVAEAAWRRAASSRNRDAKIRAQLFLGLLHEDLHRLDDAERAYRRVADSDHRDARPRAQLHLGELLARQGRLDEAEAAYRAAIASDDRDVTPWAHIGLAHLLVKLDRSGEAIATLQSATDDHEAGAAARAYYDLGTLFHRLGRSAEAEAALRSAVTTGRGGHVARLAEVSLHEQMRGAGGDADAATAYRRAAGEDPSQAKIERAAMLADLGQAGEAEGSLREVIDGDHHPEATPWAYWYLGRLCERQGRLGEAEEAFDAASRTGHVDVAQRARYHMAKVLMKQGRQHEAEQAYRDVIAGENLEVASRARLSLALMLAESQPDVAEAALEATIRDGHPSVRPDAQLALGKLLMSRERYDEAAEAFTTATASDDPDVAAWSLLNLAELRASQGRSDDAVLAFRRAISSRHKEVAGWAHWGLACLLDTSGRHDDAVAEYGRATTSGSPEAAALAKERLDRRRRQMAD